MSPLSSLRCPNTKHFYESASYISANRRFTDAILKNYQGDVILVNNYHLMLLPNLLWSNPKLPCTAPIGFFIHFAFPPFEIFRRFSLVEDLLLGLLGVDLVVFAVPGYQLRTPLPTDCFTQIGVRGPTQGDSSPGTLRPSGGWRRRPRRVGE